LLHDVEPPSADQHAVVMWGGRPPLPDSSESCVGRFGIFAAIEYRDDIRKIVEHLIVNREWKAIRQRSVKSAVFLMNAGGCLQFLQICSQALQEVAI
jgi:hypothetical protein